MNQQLCIVITAVWASSRGYGYAVVGWGGVWVGGDSCECNAIRNGSRVTVRGSVFRAVQVVLVFWMLHNEPASSFTWAMIL